VNINSGNFEKMDVKYLQVVHLLLAPWRPNVRMCHSPTMSLHQVKQRSSRL